MARNIANVRLAALKKIGLLSDISNRGHLSESQARKVRETYKEYEEVVTAPKGAYSTVSARKLTPDQINSLREYGIPVIGGKAYVPTSGFHKASLLQTTVVTNPGSRNRFFQGRQSALEVVRKLEVTEGEKSYTKEEREIISNVEASTMEGRIDEMIRRLGPLQFGEHYAIKTRGNRIYRKGSALSGDSLKTYIFRVAASGSTNPENPLDEDDFFQDVQVVKIKQKNKGFSYDPSELTSKEYNRQKQKRYRKRQKGRGRLGK